MFRKDESISLINQSTTGKKYICRKNSVQLMGRLLVEIISAAPYNFLVTVGIGITFGGEEKYL